jgi:ankyrin repeat protein
MLAAQNGHLPVVNLLLQAGADPAATDEAGRKAAHYAELGGHADIATRLREPGQADRSDL